MSQGSKPCREACTRLTRAISFTEIGGCSAEKRNLCGLKTISMGLLRFDMPHDGKRKKAVVQHKLSCPKTPAFEKLRAGVFAPKMEIHNEIISVEAYQNASHGETHFSTDAAGKNPIMRILKNREADLQCQDLRYSTRLCLKHTAKRLSVTPQRKSVGKNLNGGKWNNRRSHTHFTCKECISLFMIRGCPKRCSI